jgi:hypothetical protein
MEQIPRITYSCSASKEIIRILYNQNVYYGVQKSQPRVPIPSQLNTLNTARCCTLNYHLNTKSYVFWDITPYSPLKSQPTFRRKHVASFFRVEE